MPSLFLCWYKNPKINPKKMTDLTIKFQHLIFAVVIALVIHSMIILFRQDDDDENRK
jgi:hypothetical protein